MSLFAGPKPEENCHPATFPSCTQPDNPQVIYGPVGTDKGFDIHHSGKWQGGGEKPAVACDCSSAWLGCGMAAQDLCFSGGRWVDSRAWGCPG